MQRRLAEGLGVGLQHVLAAALGQGLRDALGCQHAALDGRVHALDAGRVQEARLAAHQTAAREDQLRQGVDAASRDGARAVLQATAALEGVAQRRVRLPALEFLEG